MPLYADEQGRAISTHSMLKTFRRCPKQTEYKYVQRLKPKVVSKPLKRGDWVHKLLESYYRGDEWRDVHRDLSAKFNEMFDEEKDHYGDLPTECGNIMRSYLWHYKHDDWRVHDVEFTIETAFPNGDIYRCKIDLLVEDEFGLWIVDHKTTRTIPDIDFRILDAQSALYLWCALKNKLPVQGFIWNWVKTKAPTIPQITKKGRLSARKIETDYPTMIRALKSYELKPSRYEDILEPLKLVQYRHGEPQTSPYYRRDPLEKDARMLGRVAREGYKTSKRMNAYFPTDIVERVPEKVSCSWCSYVNICTVELFGGDSRLLRRTRFTQGDPLEYYHDDKAEGGEG